MVNTNVPAWCALDLDTKSLVIITGVATLTTTTVVGYLAVRKYVAIGPFTSANEGNALARSVQRFVQSKTRRDLSCPWFVGQSLLDRVPSRASNNGHAAAGAVRDEARRLIANTILAEGWKKLEIAPSGLNNPDYTVVQHYAPSDLKHPVSDDIHEDWQVIVGIDVDYYITDPGKYLEYGRPAIFHTFNPLKVSGRDGDCRFRIRNDEVIYEVGGGGKWQHNVWDWCAPGEFIATECNYQWIPWLLRKIGLVKTVYHKVYHARPWVNCPDRALVWCVPDKSAWSVSFLANDMHARKLAPVKYTDKHRPGWNRIVAPAAGQPGGDLMVSVGRQGEDAEVTIRKTDYDVLMGLGNAQAVTTRMIGMKYTQPQELALMGQYHKGDLNYVPDCTSIVASSTLVHWPYSTECDVPEVSSREYAKPLVDEPNAMPMTKRWETLSCSLEHRVTFVANTKLPNKHLAEYASEFVALVVPEAGVGIPLTPEEARDQLDKPSQKLAVKAVWDTLDVAHRPLIESFVKNEPTNKNGRIISSFADARFLLLFSRYTLAFRDQVLHADHNKHWFCPGLTPREIAEKVQEYCSAVTGVIEGDYSNFDGRVSSWLQKHVMNAVYHRFFGPQYAQELKAFTSNLVTCPARAKKFGFQYDAGVGVKSGSPTTCDLNTVLNAFLMYVAIRRTNTTLTREDCFRSIGLAFGDDSLFERQYKAQWVKATEQVGMELKVEVCKPETGVCFLARVFPDPCATLTSFQDPLRTWRKLHLTARDPLVPLADAARDRLEGYLITDGLTPLTSHYCRMVIRCLGRETSYVQHKRLERKDRLKEKPYWLTEGGSWPQHNDDILVMLMCIVERTGLAEEQIRTAIANCESAVDVWSGPKLQGVPALSADGVRGDGTTAEPEVDLVSVTSLRHVNHRRANAGGGGQHGGVRADTGRGGNSPGQLPSPERRQQDPSRPAELCSLSDRSTRQTRHGNDSSPGQARSVQTPQRHQQRRGNRQGPGGARERQVPQYQERGQRQEPPSPRRPVGPQAPPRAQGTGRSNQQGASRVRQGSSHNS